MNLRATKMGMCAEMIEGRPDFPNNSLFCESIEQHTQALICKAWLKARKSFHLAQAQQAEIEALPGGSVKYFVFADDLIHASVGSIKVSVGKKQS
jgi:hypothetical protein